MKHYSQVFKPTEVLMMLSAFSQHRDDPHRRLQPPARHHRHARARILGLPQIQGDEGQVRLHAVLHASTSKHEIAKTLAAFGAFTEGLQLFASFAILLNFPRFNKMKGMGQIVSWSVRDETLHCLSIIRLFRTFVQENPEIWTEELRREIYRRLRHHRRPRGRLHRPRLRAGLGRGPDARPR